MDKQTNGQTDTGKNVIFSVGVITVGERFVSVDCIVSRLEEKDIESGKDYGKLHERYTDVSDLIIFCGNVLIYV